MKHGFLKVAAAAPELRVADPLYNAAKIAETMRACADGDVKLLVFPELSITGATCGDLFYQNTLLRGAAEGLRRVVEESAGLEMLVFVGLPVEMNGKLYSCAAAVCDGEVLGVVPMRCPGDKHFALADDMVREVQIGNLYPVCFSTDLLFENTTIPGLKVAAQLGGDACAPVAPAAAHALAGATVIAQLSSFPMRVDSAERETAAVREQSARLRCGLVMAAPGSGESSTDAVYSGLCVVAENGAVLAATEDGVSVAITELDIETLTAARRRDTSFSGQHDSHVVIRWGMQRSETPLTRGYSKYPFRPADEKDYHAAAKRLLHMQAASLARRMQYAGLKYPVVGISGGVDSTLAVIICAEAVKLLGLPPENVTAVTMPCFGTTDRTKSNAIVVSEQLGATVRVIDIGESVMLHFKDIGHDPENRNIVYENAQARERTQILMDIANQLDGGIHVGTEDLSEFADGWCTYNGDHISMYDVNVGATKTMVQMVVRYVAETTDDKVLADALFDVLDTPVSPELLPPTRNGEIAQKSEESVGPYNLQDFFLYYLVEQGFTPGKVLRLADIAYGDEFDHETLKKWLRSYCRRLFSQQFKRSCLQDGPTLCGFSFSPRTGFLMPSDGSPELYLDVVDKLE